MLTTTPFQEFSLWVEQGFPAKVAPSPGDDLFDRIRQIVSEDSEAAPHDLAVLLRQAIRRESETHGGSPITLVLPKFPGGPDHATLQRAGLRILRERPHDWVLSADPWQPEWLPDSDREAPDAKASAEVQRRTHSEVPGDPFLKRVKLETYRNVGQREAMRAILTAPPGATLAVNLPTGAGKSLCAQLPALILGQPRGVSVIVVPTVALAIDQERAMHAMGLKDAMAYYHDDSPSGQKRRQEIRTRIANGEQTVVFTSPEGLLESLCGALFTAAEAGYLKLFVIDEAHIVDQWGDEFRPAFQELPGLRRALLKASPKPFLTLLLSATLPRKSLETLHHLFSDPETGPFRVISATQLRPEPTYWVASCGDDEVLKRERIEEAIWRLPRPIILYTSLKAEADAWFSHLRNLGFKRIGKMTGSSTEEERRSLMQKWSAGEVDLVVGTSAFGLGIDQATTRSVIHACVPETLDRFYQEVGRGGRDGKACVSLLVYWNADLESARGLNQKRFVGIERGLARWQAMWAHKGKMDAVGLRFRMDLRRAPVLDMDSDENIKWNSRTLLLMSKAGLIGLDFEPPPAGSDDDPKSYEKFRRSRVVEIREQAHLDREVWESRIEPLRQTLMADTEAGFKAMKQALSGDTCLADLLADFYGGPLPEPLTGRVSVQKACGGCPACRAADPMLEPYAGFLPTPISPWKTLTPQEGGGERRVPVGAQLEGRLDANHRFVVTYEKSLPPPQWRSRLSKVMLWAYQQGVRAFVAPEEALKRLQEDVKSLPGSYTFSFTAADYPPLKVPTHVLWTPTLFLIDEEEGQTNPQVEKLVRQLRSTNRFAPVEFWMIPSELRDPLAPHRKLAEIYNGSLARFTAFCAAQGL